MIIYLIRNFVLGIFAWAFFWTIKCVQISQVLIKFINFNYYLKFNVNRNRNGTGRKYFVHFFDVADSNKIHKLQLLSYQIQCEQGSKYGEKISCSFFWTIKYIQISQILNKIRKLESNHHVKFNMNKGRLWGGNIVFTMFRNPGQ